MFIKGGGGRTTSIGRSGTEGRGHVKNGRWSAYWVRSILCLGALRKGKGRLSTILQAYDQTPFMATSQGHRKD